MIGSKIFTALINLSASNFLYRCCRRYVNSYDNQNNVDMRSNGELCWLQEVLPACFTIFDVGANVGEWTALALEINPSLQVHCFEPSAATYRFLQAHVTSSSVFLNQKALGASRGEYPLYVSGPGAGTNSLHKRTAPNLIQNQTENIYVETLDAYCEAHAVKEIDLLKVDVEGHELEVLKGAINLFKEGRIRRIQFEYGGTYIDARILLKDMFDFLIPFGYRIYKMYPNYLRLFEQYDQRLENFQYQNLVALKS